MVQFEGDLTGKTLTSHKENEVCDPLYDPLCTRRFNDSFVTRAYIISIKSGTSIQQIGQLKVAIEGGSVDKSTSSRFILAHVPINAVHVFFRNPIVQDYEMIRV